MVILGFAVVAYLVLHGIVAILFLVLLAGLARSSVVSGCLRWLAVPFGVLDLIAAALNLRLGDPYCHNVFQWIGRVELIAFAIVVTLAVRTARKSIAREEAADDDRRKSRDSTTRSAASRLRTGLVLGLLAFMLWELLRGPAPIRSLHEGADVGGVRRRLDLEELPSKDPGRRMLGVFEATPPLEDKAGNVDSAGLEWAWTQLGSDVDLDTGHGHIRQHADRLLMRELEALAPDPGGVAQVSKLARVESRAKVLSAAASITSLSPAAFDAIFSATAPHGGALRPDARGATARGECARGSSGGSRSARQTVRPRPRADGRDPRQSGRVRRSRRRVRTGSESGARERPRPPRRT